MISPESDARSKLEQANREAKEMRVRVVRALLSSPRRAGSVAIALLTYDKEIFEWTDGGMRIGLTLSGGLGNVDYERGRLDVGVQDVGFEGGISTVVSSHSESSPGAFFVPKPFSPTKRYLSASHELFGVEEVLRKLR